MSARLASALATQPEGDGTLIPRPLSSQTKSSGTGRCWWAAWAVVLSAACAVAWFSEASPKLQTTTASLGPGGTRRRACAPGRSRSRRRRHAAGGRRSSRSAGSPQARGCRRPCAGHRRSARRSRRRRLASRRERRLARPGRRGRDRRHRSGSGVALDRSGAGRVRRRHCSRAQPSRSSRSCGAPSAASAPRDRSCRLSICARQSASASVASPSGADGLPGLQRLECREKVLLERIEVVGDHRRRRRDGSAEEGERAHDARSRALPPTRPPRPASTSPCSRAARASASSRDSVPMIRCFHWRIGR